jgi:hypothetical protein
MYIQNKAEERKKHKVPPISAAGAAYNAGSSLQGQNGSTNIFEIATPRGHVGIFTPSHWHR